MGFPWGVSFDTLKAACDRRRRCWRPRGCGRRALPQATRDREPAEEPSNAAPALPLCLCGRLAAEGFPPPRLSAKLVDTDVRRQLPDSVRWQRLRGHEINVPPGLSATRASARPSER